jgi:hypothetical protein|tara:strand:- start:747 stop:1010 length:264 start_codon:yes stop_codon:yes gene_type:complete
MKNNTVLGRFGQYVGATAVAMMSVYMIVLLSQKYLGDPSYGIIAIMTAFMLTFLYSMAKSDVENKEREARWAAQDAERKASRKMLME